MAKAKAGPVVTDNGNLLLDWRFKEGKSPEEIRAIDWAKVNQRFLNFPGVVETGIFVDMARVIYFGMADGSVKRVDK